MLSQKGAVPHEAGTFFGLWAPNATAVFVTGTFNDWSPTSHPLAPQDEGWWSADITGVKPGDEYRFRIVAGETELSRIDPYARRLTSSVGNAIVPRPIAAADTASFTPPALNETVIYELHIGTFGRATEPGPSDLEDAVEKLAYLKELGINAIEVMPLSEFPGGFSWGYNPSHIFSVESDYGTPRSFRDFVNHDDKVIAYHRWDQGGPGDSVIVVANFSARQHTDYEIGVPAGGPWNVRFNSDRKIYDPDFGDVGAAAITARNEPRDGLPAQAAVSLAPYNTLILSQDPA